MNNFDENIIRNIVSKVLEIIPEYDIVNGEYQCTGSCKEISTQLQKYLNELGVQCKLIYTTKDVERYEIKDAEHTALYLIGYKLIIDTQVWQFISERLKNWNYVDVESIKTRKIVFTKHEYFNQLKFKL